MRLGFIFVCAFFVLVGPWSLAAEPSNVPHSSPRPDGGSGDLIPLSVSSFPELNDVELNLPTTAEPSLRMVYHGGGESRFLDSQSSGSTGGTSYLPVLFSLLVPGTGEMYMGYWARGGVLLGLEVAAWAGYIHYHNQGLDGRIEYEQFADTYWDYDRWVFDHPANESVDPANRTFETLDEIGRTVWEGWPGYHTWHSKEEEKQNYYENIGKYDWFISGWQDWDPAAKPMNTDLRTQYRQMRISSNDDLDTANKFIYLSIATRVVSLVQTYFLVRRDAKRSAEMSQAKTFSIDAHATGLSSGQVSLVYRFK